MVSKVFEKLVKNRHVDQLEKLGGFFCFQYSFRFSRSIADLVTVVSGRVARAFNRFAATRAVAFDISNAFDRIWHADLLHKHKSDGIPSQIFGLILSFLSNQGFTNGICRRCTYAYFYYRMHDFEHAYIDMYAHFFPMVFESFQNFSGFYNFILFKNLLLHIWPLICLSLEAADALLFTFAL